MTEQSSDLFGTAVQPLFEKHRAEFLAHARTVARDLGRHGRPITINDVRHLITMPEDIDPRVMGAVFRTDEWVNIGYTSSKRPVSHGRPVAQFVLRGDSVPVEANGGN